MAAQGKPGPTGAAQDRQAERPTRLLQELLHFCLQLFLCRSDSFFILLFLLFFCVVLARRRHVCFNANTIVTKDKINEATKTQLLASKIPMCAIYSKA